MSDKTISVEWVIGVDEVTAWFWPESPDPVTVRFSVHEWAKLERKAEAAYNGDIEECVTVALRRDVEAIGEDLSE